MNRHGKSKALSGACADEALCQLPKILMAFICKSVVSESEVDREQILLESLSKEFTDDSCSLL